MLIRAYRISDRLGLLILKISTSISTYLAESLRALLSIFGGGGRQVLNILGGLLGIILTVLMTGFSLITSGASRAGNTAFRLTGRTAQAATSSASGAMARRYAEAQARAEIDTAIVEDPLKRQNRLLSGLVVLVLGTLIVIVVWATSNTGNDSPFTPSSAGLGLASNPTVAAEPAQPEDNAEVGLALPTAVPTATLLPDILQVRGAVAYVVREKGQTDIWATPIDTLNPIRLTNSPTDERDPAWSPDGTQLAYASNKNGNWDIYIYDLLTGDERQMTIGLAFEAGPRWSPNGEFLVYESYNEAGHLDIYILRTDGSAVQEPRVPQSSETADFSPAWSPDGTQMAFVSWRDGNQDIYVFTIADSSIYNLTSTPDVDEDYPVWSPDGNTIAYSAVEAGRELVYTHTAAPNTQPQLFRQGRTPAWSPDGNSIILATDTRTSTLFTVAPYNVDGAATEAFNTASTGAYHPDWTETPLPAALVNAGGLPSAVPDPLFVEDEGPGTSDPPYGLENINVDGVGSNGLLSERVNDSFQALRISTNQALGWDMLGSLSDVFWDINDRPPAGQDPRSWFKTGRAFAFNRNRIVGFPPQVEVVREDTELATFWRVYVRVADDAQNGQLGEPLRVIPWDFERETVESYDRGGALKPQMPRGYYVDLTQMAADYGWDRVPAEPDWRDNFDVRNYWVFQKRDGLTWYDAMRELYTFGAMGGFNPTATPAPVQPTAPPAPDVNPTEES